MSFLPSRVEDKHLDVFMALADGFIHNVSPATIRLSVTPEFAATKLDQYTREVTKPLEIPGFREFIRHTIDTNTTKSVGLFCVLMNVLDLRVLSPALTGTTKLVREMNDAEREAVLKSWRDLPILAKQRLFHLLYMLSVTTFQRLCPPLHSEAMDCPKTDNRDELYEGHSVDPFRYKMMDPPLLDGVELYLPNIDAVIIGLGLGAGVAAHTLLRAGAKVLVIEKGKYYSPSEFNFTEATGYAALYEGGGLVATTNSQCMILAGATFGGGSTVNWAACLKTPFKVRKEWYDDYGVDFVATESFDNDMEYVLKQMGATTEHITHSHSNKVLLEGAEKLGYEAKTIPQNTGVHTNHSCGMCHLGCKWGIKQGSLANWLRDAADHGAEFMDEVSVEKITRRKGVAIGLECIHVPTRRHFSIRGPRKYIVAGGLLHTPVLLEKSGFKNKHIGRNLKLHPISAIMGFWDKKTDPHFNSIMTSACTEADDVDGKAHGAKIETLLHTPTLESAFMPWHSSDQIRQLLLKYQGTGTYIILDRDTLSGTVTYDKNKPDALVVDYDINKFDRAAMVKAILCTADIIYVEGAKEIIHPFWKIDIFKSDKPIEQRSIDDKDYQAWRKTVENTPLTPYGLTYGSAHQMSTCRMSGKGPGYGACDTKGRLFECDNVYVADASVLPTASGANPMVSTMACARHIAKGIAKDLAPSAKL